MLQIVSQTVIPSESLLSRKKNNFFSLEIKIKIMIFKSTRRINLIKIYMEERRLVL